MSIIVDGTSVSLIHIRHDGRSHGIRSEDLGIEGAVTQQDLFTAVENHLDLNIDSLSGYELDVIEETENAIIRPTAKFGI